MEGDRMINYIKPDWYKNGISSENLKSFDISVAKEEMFKIIDENNQRYKDEQKIVSEILRLIELVYGKDSSLYKYFIKNGRIERPPSIDLSLSNLEDRKKKILDEEKKKEKDLGLEKEKAKLLVEAVIYCQQNGKTFGVDFTESDAIDVANNIAWDLEVKNRMSGTDYVSFGGDDNCEDCFGWDGESRRCSCGNRRVSWEFEGNFKNPYVYAQAW